MAENLERWKPLLEEVLEPDNDKIRKGQVLLAFTALANSARMTALPLIFFLVEKARFDINQRLPAAFPRNATQHITDFFRSNYAGLLTLLQKGATIPGASKNSKGTLLAIAQDSQSTHTSQVNLVLKKHIRVAEALIAKYASNSVERLKAELAAFCTDHSENKSGHRLQDLRVTEAYLVDSYDGTNF